MTKRHPGSWIRNPGLGYHLVWICDSGFERTWIIELIDDIEDANWTAPATKNAVRRPTAKNRAGIFSMDGWLISAFVNSKTFFKFLISKGFSIKTGACGWAPKRWRLFNCIYYSGYYWFSILYSNIYFFTLRSWFL